MASKLCCTTEQEGRADSPDLPNVRISDPAPAKLPLLPPRPDSQGSRFTSVRSEDLHELRQIFNVAKDSEDSKLSTPTKLHRSPLARTSLYSLHSLHRMKSLNALIKRKFSRDLVITTSDRELKNISSKNISLKKSSTIKEVDTVVKVPRDGPNMQLKVTKNDLRKNLLSDKKPDEGGYDSDAEMLDDIARNIGKKTASKRASIHSIDWTSSPGSKQTPGSIKDRHSSDIGQNCQLYQIKQPQSVQNSPSSARFGQFTSSPNLRVHVSKSKNRILRRSHSTTSIEHPVPSPLSPRRLRSSNTNGLNAASSSTNMHESFCLLQIAPPLRRLSSNLSKSSLHANLGSTETENNWPDDDYKVGKESENVSAYMLEEKTSQVQTYAQQSMPPLFSVSIQDSNKRHAPLVENEAAEEAQNDDEDDPRCSVHLYSMRISHHLRSGSLLSSDTLANESDMSTLTRPSRDRTTSNHILATRPSQRPVRTRGERQSSSSVIAISAIASSRGNRSKELSRERDHREDISSIYSSRPQSPPDSFGGSMRNLSRSVTHLDCLKSTTTDLAQRRNLDSYPLTANEDAPGPAYHYDIRNIRATSSATLKIDLNKSSIPRNNSVANTKKSKFREEFSPSPPRKKPSATIMKFLNSKRSCVRSQSETDIKAETLGVDGPSDQSPAAVNRNRHLSRSLMSLRTEQLAAEKEKMTNSMWEQALKAHQEERSSFFLSPNKELATQGSPMRERSGSVMKMRASMSEEIPPRFALTTSNRLSVPFLESPSCGSKRFSAPFLDTQVPDELSPDFSPSLLKRRDAFSHGSRDKMSPDHEVQAAFEKQAEDATTVGAWGRYPSHSRPERTYSAGHLDNVRQRDFALENAMRFAMGTHVGDEDDPTARPETPPPIIGKKRKKRVSAGRMVKSNSMTFGRQFLKNYTKIFRSQSTEFQRHGHGHRSSITTGGTLEYPELEILPEVWRHGIFEERNRDDSGESQDAEETGNKEKDTKGKAKSRADDSMATLRPKNSNADDATVAVDGSPADRARIWSTYYEDCVPDFLRGSLDWNSHLQDFELQDFGKMPASQSLDVSRHSTMRRSTLPARLQKYSRRGSRTSRISVVSTCSARPSFVFLGEGENGDADGADEKSVISVRRSTMDLITLYHDQEVREREKVLSLARVESGRSERERKKDREIMTV